MTPEYFAEERRERLARRQGRIRLRWFWIACWGLLAATFSSGQPTVPQVLQPGPHPYARENEEPFKRIRATLKRLLAVRLTDAGGARPWRWIVLNETEWATETRRFRARTPYAFSNLAMRTTWLRGFLLARMSDQEVDRILSHELGHIDCWCNNEKLAEYRAAAIRQGAVQMAGLAPGNRLN